MELNSANKNPSHDSFIVCIDKQAYKLSLQITKNVKNSEKLKKTNVWLKISSLQRHWNSDETRW